MAALEPDPKSRVGAARFIAGSSSAGRMLVVIAYRDLDGDLHPEDSPTPHPVVRTVRLSTT